MKEVIEKHIELKPDDKAFTCTLAVYGTEKKIRASMYGGEVYICINDLVTTPLGPEQYAVAFTNMRAMRYEEGGGDAYYSVANIKKYFAKEPAKKAALDRMEAEVRSVAGGELITKGKH